MNFVMFVAIGFTQQICLKDCFANIVMNTKMVMWIYNGRIQ